jgi:hypothetical protein
MLSSLDAKPIINIVINFYFFVKSLKSMSSSTVAKPNKNVVIIGCKTNYQYSYQFLLFREKFKINVVINGRKTK